MKGSEEKKWVSQVPEWYFEQWYFKSTGDVTYCNESTLKNKIGTLNSGTLINIGTLKNGTLNSDNWKLILSKV